MKKQIKHNMTKLSFFTCFALVVFSGSQVSSAPIAKREESGVKTTLEAPTTSLLRNVPNNGQDFVNYLIKFGYMDNSEKSKNSALGDDESIQALKDFQHFTGLKVTGKLDDQTKALMQRSRCGNPDLIPARNGTHKKRYVANASWRSTRSLTYKILNGPSKTYSLDVSTSLSTAFMLWTQAANIDITPTTGNSNNIAIGFYSGDHRDGAPFDGSSGVLAHAFFPEDGRLHFDNAETWSGTGYGTNLMQVATHEIGHILGLGHSSVQGSVMYPYYTYSSSFGLRNDDYLGIISLYGPRSTYTTTTTTKKPWWKWLFGL